MSAALAAMAVGGSLLSAYGALEEGKATARSYKAKADALRKRSQELRARADINIKSTEMQRELNQSSYANAFAGAGVKRQGSSYTGTLMELSDRAQLEIDNINREAQYEISTVNDEIDSLNTASGYAEKASKLKAISSLLSGGSDTYKAFGYPGLT